MQVASHAFIADNNEYEMQPEAVPLRPKWRYKRFRDTVFTLVKECQAR